MKKIYALILTILFVGSSCSKKDEEVDPGNGTTSDVELRIVHTSAGTRATLPYPSAAGTEEERRIMKLDIIAFDSNTGDFVYVRPAYPTTGNTYRATLPVQHKVVNAALVANCPGACLKDLLASAAWLNSGKKWADFKKLLVDENPERLVNYAFQPLPMSTELMENKAISEVGVNHWGSIQLLRSVASVDVVMEKNEATSKLELTKVHAYYAVDKGYFLALEKTGTSPLQYQMPDGAETLKTLTATRVGQTQTTSANGQSTQYDAVTGQLYMYDNNMDSAADNQSGKNKYTRVIVEGYYNQASETGAKKPSFYPVFLVDGNKFRPVIRNYKYLLLINAVHGPGYDTLEEAADSYPINLNMEIIDWNLTDVEVGVNDSYYVSVNKKTALLDRYAGSKDSIQLTFRGELTDQFKTDFKTNDNGVQKYIFNGVENSRFKVTLTTDIATGTAQLLVEAQGDYSDTASENQDVLILTYRNLTFEIAIHQLDQHNDDWKEGGDIPVDL